jgi:hypothetical protein
MPKRGFRHLTWIIPLVVLTGFFAAVLASMLGEGAAECRVCVSFEGQRQCATGKAPTEAAAREEAHRSACSRMAAGVTEAFACPNQPPDEVQCKAP